MKIWIFASLGALTVAGCQTNPDTGSQTIIGPTAAAGVVSVDTAQTASIAVVDAPPEGSADLGQVEGTSCRNNPADPTPTEERALAQLKQKAATMGATGVTAVTYKKGGTSFATNCWSTVTATGRAFR